MAGRERGGGGRKAAAESPSVTALCRLAAEGWRVVVPLQPRRVRGGHQIWAGFPPTTPTGRRRRPPRGPCGCHLVWMCRRQAVWRELWPARRRLSRTGHAGPLPEGRGWGGGDSVSGVPTTPPPGEHQPIESCVGASSFSWSSGGPIDCHMQSVGPFSRANGKAVVLGNLRRRQWK